MKYLKSLLSNRRAIVAGTVETIDLPVNPVSHIDIDLEATLAAAFTQAQVADFAGALAFIEVLYKGTSVVAMTGMDLLAYTAGLWGKYSPIDNRDLLVASQQAFRFRIPFGRFPYSGVECFPSVRRGDLQLRITYAAAFANIVTLFHTITTTELPGATPKQFLKATTLALTPVVGDNDVDLPIGNRIYGMVCFSTTVPAGVAIVTSLDLVKLLRDNVEEYYHQVRWPILHQTLYEKLGWKTPEVDHAHYSNLAVGYVQFANTDLEVLREEPFAQYGFMDFDPLRDDSYFLDTVGAGRIWLRITAGDANPIRVLPIELIEVPAA